MKRSALTATVSLLAVFVSGTVVGALGSKLYMVKTVVAGQHPGRETPEEWRRHYVADLTARLKLDSNQLTQLNQILDETRDEYLAVRAKYRPEMDAIHQRQVERVSAMLTPTQKTEYDQFRAERDRQRKQAEGKKGPG